MARGDRRKHGFSYEETVAKRANVKSVIALISPLLESNGELAIAVPAARKIWESAPGDPRFRRPLDVTPWNWLRDTARDAHALGDYQSAARIAVAIDVWQWMLDQNGDLAAETGLVRPPPDVIADVFSLGLDCVSRLDSRFPLLVTQSAVYLVEDVAQRFAASLLQLAARGYPIDPTTYRFALSIRRP